MLLARTRTRPHLRDEFFDRSAFTLRPTASGSDDQRLAQRMCVPRRPRARLEVTMAPDTSAGSGA